MHLRTLTAVAVGVVAVVASVVVPTELHLSLPTRCLLSAMAVVFSFWVAAKLDS